VAKSPPAYTTPSVLRWARETIGLSLDAAAAKIGVSPDRLEGAEAAEGHLTMRQAESAARAYQRPLAALFLPEPPPEEPPEAEFRRLPGAPEPPWPPEMRALARRIRDRQDRAAELYELLEEEPPWRNERLPYHEDAIRAADLARPALGVDLAQQKLWRDHSGFRPLRAWIDGIESLGVLVMQDGSMDMDFMRGFASTHPDVPAVVVNTRDDPRARAFTVVHELGHLIRIQAKGRESATDEDWCNRFAGEVLAPSAVLAADYERESKARPLVQRVDGLALSYGLTPLAMAVRLRILALVSQADADSVIEEIQVRWRQQPAAAKGGNYYRTMVTRLGPTFVQLVFAALDNQAVTYPAAAGLLGVKVNNFEKLRRTTLDRAGIA
jgi:Zn-dependent peptidase ImmA (M78 family)